MNDTYTAILFVGMVTEALWMSQYAWVLGYCAFIFILTISCVPFVYLPTLVLDSHTTSSLPASLHHSVSLSLSPSLPLSPVCPWIPREAKNPEDQREGCDFGLLQTLSNEDFHPTNHRTLQVGKYIFNPL